MAPTKKASVKTAPKAKKPPKKTAKKKSKVIVAMTKAAMGRPVEYNSTIRDMIHKLCLLGATDKEICNIVMISEGTLNLWKTKHPDLLESIREGKELADANVAQSLYKRACGYEHKATKIMQYEGKIITQDYIERYAPDTNAARMWLTNRHPDKWRDKVEHTVQGGDQPLVIDMSGKTKDEREAMRQILAGIAVSPTTDT